MEFLTGLASSFPIPAWLSQVAFVIVAVWATVSFVIKCFKFYDKTETRNNNYESIDKKLASIESKHSTLIGKFNALIGALAEKSALDNPELFSFNSPIKLTEKGRDLVSEIGWVASLEISENKKILFDMLDKCGLKTKYDVEKYSIVLLTELAGARTENPYTSVKRYLYEHSQVDDFRALTACAIYLRDKYLQEHPEISE